MSKYPRTFHLPFSPCVSKDDKRMKDVGSLLNVPLIFSEKMDGQNVTMMRDGCFARSHNGPPKHKSFNLFKAIHADIRLKIPENIQIFGEWLYATKVIRYYNLPSYLMAIGIRDLSTNKWLGPAESQRIASMIGVSFVPILSGIVTVSSEKELHDTIKELMKMASPYSKEKEGIVVRLAEEFDDKDFSKYVGKYVKKNFVPEKTKHWKFKKIEKNLLFKDS
jgi:hypothetical protein